MRINKINIQNFKGIRKASINLDGKSAVFFGINGAGKTSILEAITIVISKVLSEAALSDKLIDVSSITVDDMKSGYTKTQIQLEIDYENGNYKIHRNRIVEVLKKSSNISLLAKQIQKKVGIIRDEDGRAVLELNSESIPIFVNYGINRIDRKERPFKISITGDEKIDAWRDSICEGRILAGKFYDWYRKRQEVEYFKKINENIEYEDIQLAMVKKSLLSAFGEHYSDIYYKSGKDSGLYVKKNGIELNTKQLSEGELNVILLIGDIARRLSIANPGIDNSCMGEGIVMIDEIDSHIHPSWQAHIFDVLTKSFPNVQFIATTHAPRVLNSLDDSVKVISLENENGDVEIEDVSSLNGWDVNDIMYRFMDTEVLNSSTKELISKLETAIDEGKLKEAKKLKDELALKTSSDNLEVVRAAVLIGGKQTEKDS